MPEEQRKAFEALRMVYGPALLNGPFAILVSDGNCLMGLNDRIKLRPLIVAESGSNVFMSSEESSIRDVCRELDTVWAPKAGEPVIVKLED
jgi:glutamate synthase domain-containing protein 1